MKVNQNVKQNEQFIVLANGREPAGMAAILPPRNRGKALLQVHRHRTWPPAPIWRSSISRTGVTSAAVPVMNASSARYVSSRVNRSRPPDAVSRRTARTASRRNPGENRRVRRRLHAPPRTMKMFSPLHSET